jgi:hypothetical protein
MKLRTGRGGSPWLVVIVNTEERKGSLDSYFANV